MNAALRRWLTNPGVLFALAWALLLAVLFAPLLAGGVIVNPLSDGKDGYVTRHFAATVIAAWGEIPRWDPYIFGGQPFLGAMYGDQAYPISIILRAIFPPALGIGLGMVLHLWLGAVGMLVFLRRLRHQWASAIVGATAYGLGGPLIGLLFPGHDGKIFCLGLLPWGLTAILEGARTAKPVAFAGWGAIIGLMLLSPHFQMTYYFSMLAGAWVLFLLFTETSRSMRWRFLAGMTIGSVGGLLLAGAQLLPFIDYLPFSPRTAGGSSTSGWAFATSYALPALELIGTAWGGFNGWLGNYWGTNFFKLHSEYLGLLVAVLAIGGAWGGLSKPGPERRLTWFWVGAIIFGTLWALGGQTPFYRIPYGFFPGISKTRAPGMIWGHVSACVAVLAAMGFARIQAMTAEERSRWARRALIATATAAAFLALAAPGMIRALAPSQRYAAAVAAVPGAQWGILLGAFTVIAFALVAWRAPRWLPHAAVVVIALDLIVQDKRFIVIDPRGAGVFAPDQVVQAIQRDATSVTQPWRVLPLQVRDNSRPPYMDDYFIEHRIRSVLGYHGNEQHRYDELLGGKNAWTRLPNPVIWRHLAVRYVLTDGAVEAPGLLAPVAGPALTWLGDTAWVYRVVNAAPWARVVPVAFRASDADVHQLVVAPQFDPDRAALVPPDAPFGLDPTPEGLPPAITPPVSVKVTERQPGVYVLALDGLTQDGVLVISENWLPSWTAAVDGRPAPVARANGTFIAVPVPARSREVVLSYDSPADRRGRMASFAGLGGLLVLALAGLRLKKPAQAA